MPKFMRLWGINVSEGGLEPPCPLRALAPQASASAYSATRTRDARGTHRLSYLSKPNAPRRVPRPPNPAARRHASPNPRRPRFPFPRVLNKLFSTGHPNNSYGCRVVSPVGRGAIAEANASHISTTSTVSGSASVDRDDRSAAGRHGTGIPRRQNALDPAFHAVPTGPARPDRDADGVSVA